MSCLTLGSAYAQPGTVESAVAPTVDRPVDPTFATMDHHDGSSKIGTQLDFSKFDETFTGTGSYRLTVDGHYLWPSGLGVYGVIPAAWIDDGPRTYGSGSYDEFALGNLEGGVVYAMPRGGYDLYLRGGLTLPTATEDFVLALDPRLTDVILAIPTAIALRVSASPVVRSGNFILRADAGIDLMVLSFGDPYATPPGGPTVIRRPTDGRALALRLNVGGGIHTGTFALLGEIVNVLTVHTMFEDHDDVPDPELLHSLALTARFFVGGLEPGLSIAVPLQQDSSHDVVDFAVAASLQARL